MANLIFKIFIIFYFSLLRSQPENKFATFDWVQYSSPGNINSISFSNYLAYLGTDNSGILRYDYIQQKFDYPIATPQGLKSNQVFLVHVLENGAVYALTSFGLEISFDGMGAWRSVPIFQMGLSNRTRFISMGSSDDYLWIKTFDSLFKFDLFDGRLIERANFTSNDIKWSSSAFTIKDFNELSYHYSIQDGWIFDGLGLMDSNGKRYQIISIADDLRGNVWIGCSNGLSLYSNKTMRFFTPLKYRFATNDINVLGSHNDLWMAGGNNFNNEGITKFNPRTFSFKDYILDDIMNVSKISINSIFVDKEDVWFGGDGLIFFDKKDDSWLDKSHKLYGNILINKILKIDNNIWLGTRDGLFIYDITNDNFLKDFAVETLQGLNILDFYFKENILITISNIGISILDTKNNKFYAGHKFGYKEKNFKYPIDFSSFSDIAFDNDKVYILNREGVISFDLKERKWSNVLNAALFNGKNANAIAVKNNIFFISTFDGVYKYDKISNLSEFYSYNFIKNVNDVYIHNEFAFFGTRNGLISFRYKNR